MGVLSPKGSQEKSHNSCPCPSATASSDPRFDGITHLVPKVHVQLIQPFSVAWGLHFSPSENSPEKALVFYILPTVRSMSIFNPRGFL